MHSFFLRLALFESGLIRVWPYSSLASFDQAYGDLAKADRNDYTVVLTYDQRAIISDGYRFAFISDTVPLKEYALSKRDAFLLIFFHICAGFDLLRAFQHFVDDRGGELIPGDRREARLVQGAGNSADLLREIAFLSVRFR